jgi:hypothetical protein
MLRTTTSRVLTRGIARNVIPSQRVIMPTITVGLKRFTSATSPDKAAAVETITQTIVSPSPGSYIRSYLMIFLFLFFFSNSFIVVYSFFGV